MASREFDRSGMAAKGYLKRSIQISFAKPAKALMMNWTLEVEVLLVQQTTRGQRIVHVFSWWGVSFGEEEGRTGIETLRVRIGGICREMSVM
jgi:hypothetical protein